MTTYYVWAGVGAIEDLDGEDHPLVTNRLDAIALFALLCNQRQGDLTLWERDGEKATLLSAKQCGPVVGIWSGQYTHTLLKPQ